MAKNTLPIIIGAVLFGLLALGLTINALLGGGSAPAPTPVAQTQTEPTPAQKVYVARRPIYPRTVITRDMIEENESATNTPNAITNPYDVVGRIANNTIQPGQVLTTDSITSSLGRVIPANIPIPAGLRGVAIWVDPDQTAAGLVDIGDRIDVIVAQELKLEKTGNQIVIGTPDYTSGRTLAQDLEVLAVDRSIQASRPSMPPPGGAANPNGNVATPEPTPAPAQPGQQNRTRLILAASPEIAQRLVAANVKGQLHITIRNPGSRDRFPLAESREYPSRLAAGPATQQAKQLSEAESRREDAKLGLEVIKAISGKDDGPAMPPVGTALPPFDPNASGGGMIIPPAPEVTVIRGTEKTRVAVPR